MSYQHDMVDKNIQEIYKKTEEKLDSGLLDSILEIWKEILKVEEVRKEDNFFELGGNSLNMIQLSNILMERYSFYLEWNTKRTGRWSVLPVVMSSIRRSPPPSSCRWKRMENC